jgi:hypothetical protein
VVTVLRVGAGDANSGLEPGSLSITADIPIAGRAAGVELADLALPVADGIWEIPLSPPLQQLANRHVFASIRDQQGNITRIARAFSVDASVGDVFHDGFETLTE